MASSWQRLGNGLRTGIKTLGSSFGSKAGEGGKSLGMSRGYYGLMAASGLGVGLALTTLTASEQMLHPPQYPWSHGGVFSSLDHESVRRGYQVYKQVCAACHSMKFIAYRNLVGVAYSLEEAKQFAEENEYPGDPDDEGNPTTRAGKLFDYFPNPYPNDEAAKAANNGALPPDLSLIVLAREGNEDYIFSLLTGYYDPPAGVEVPEGMAYNPYFPGGNISMPQQLFQDSVEYEDGTNASVSQMAKDVCAFLRWASDPYHDERKRIGFKLVTLLTVACMITFYWKRRTWTTQKSRKVVYFAGRR
ncbi:uncharacterized protein LOC135345162 [Halichondria panicea]|uniref:uncharacterized protein LOC135345162 n=1 Tax=Halichondria panicea TaxID=6063 RepID=UPI00312B523B